MTLYAVEEKNTDCHIVDFSTIVSKRKWKGKIIDDNLSDGTYQINLEIKNGKKRFVVTNMMKKQGSKCTYTQDVIKTKK